MLYYMVTGKNSSGQIINAGQTLTRDEALRLYTAANGWFVKEEDKLGSIEEGKLADVVVLSDDYYSVPDESMKKLGSRRPDRPRRRRAARAGALAHRTFFAAADATAAAVSAYAAATDGLRGVTGRLRTFGRCRSTALPGLGRHPDRVDERRECRGYLAPTWVIEKKAGKRRTPILEHPRQSPGLE
ncbi:MAG: hypothetical protein E6H48_07410 [Betaproteobacteria bacterium]|nr:MAG: hypothetical protein E6H48_07410 [Betaproteobacteria bacterium]